MLMKKTNKKNLYMKDNTLLIKQKIFQFVFYFFPLLFQLEIYSIKFKRIE